MSGYIDITCCLSSNCDASSQVFPAGGACALGLVAALVIAVSGAVAANSPSPPELAELETDKRQYAPSEAIRVTLTNLRDTAILCPAAAESCAVVRFEHEQDGAWQRWSTCKQLREVDRPLFIEPGGVREGALRRDPALRQSGVETYEGRLPEADGATDDKPDGTGRETPPPVEREVEQLIDESPPAPAFFERPGALPQGHYRLATTCAPTDQPEAYREIRSLPFEAGD